MLSKIRQYFELIKYCFFGGITTLLNLALLYVFVEMGMNYIVANTIAYIITVVGEADAFEIKHIKDAFYPPMF